MTTPHRKPSSNLQHMYRDFSQHQHHVSDTQVSPWSVCSQCTCRKWRPVYSLHRLFSLPVVHAEGVTGSEQGPDGVAGSVPTQEASNPLERLVAGHRPQICVSEADIQEVLQQETGKDRLKTMFTKTREGKLHPDLLLVWQSTVAGSAMTFVVSYIAGGRAAKEAFITKNKHKKFTTKFLALRAYNDAMVVGGIKTGISMSLKCGLFVGLFMSISQMLAVYRNKSSPWEYVAGGSVTAAILRSHLGLKGMVGGAFVGSILGLFGGTLIYLSLKLGNDAQEMRHFREIEERLREQKEVQMIEAGVLGPAEMEMLHGEQSAAVGS